MIQPPREAVVADGPGPAAGRRPGERAVEFWLVGAHLFRYTTEAWPADGRVAPMRVIHQLREGDRSHAEPLCGDWGGMDTGWTDAAEGVTCPACLDRLRESRSRTHATAQERAVAARRGVDGW